MTRYGLVPLPHFKRDIKRLQRKHIRLDNLVKVFELLHIQDAHNIKVLRVKYKDHALKGNNQGYRELHLAPNIILKYQRHQKALVLVLVKIGSHKYVLK